MEQRHEVPRSSRVGQNPAQARMETAMARLSTSERSRLTALALDKWRRRAISEALYSPLLKWRYGSGIADHLLIVPRDLRPADPSFWHELEIGQFGLAGSIAALDDKSPFVIKPPSKGWGLDDKRRLVIKRCD